MVVNVEGQASKVGHYSYDCAEIFAAFQKTGLDTGEHAVHLTLAPRLFGWAIAVAQRRQITFTPMPNREPFFQQVEMVHTTGTKAQPRWFPQALR